MSNLIKVAEPNVSQMNDLSSVSELMQNYIHSENSNVMEAIQRKLKERPLIRRFFPSRFQKEHEALCIDQMRDLFKNRQEFLTIYINLQMELARMTGDKLIISKKQQWESELIEQGIDITAHLTRISQMKLSEIGQEFERSKKDFVERMKREDKAAEACKDIEFLYQEYRTSIIFETQTFFKIIRSNLEKFEASLDISLQGALRHFTKEA